MTVADTILPPGYLGASTESRFAASFATAAIITKKAAAELIGLDEKTLDALTDAGVIRAVPRGAKLRAYTERDLRAYLLEGAAAECWPEKKPKRATGPGSGRVVPFTSLPAGRVDAPRKNPGNRGRPRAG